MLGVCAGPLAGECLVECFVVHRCTLDHGRSSMIVFLLIDTRSTCLFAVFATGVTSLISDDVTVLGALPTNRVYVLLTSSKPSWRRQGYEPPARYFASLLFNKL